MIFIPIAPSAKNPPSVSTPTRSHRTARHKVTLCQKGDDHCVNTVNTPRRYTPQLTIP